MNSQQIIVCGVVGVAAVYLGRRLAGSVRAFLSGKGGCESGCGKCGYAGKGISERKSAVSRPSEIIPLSEVRSAAVKRDNS